MLKMNYFVFFFCFILIKYFVEASYEFCDSKNKEISCDPSNISGLKPRYIFYDVNPPEGFNLRRDVYIRMAVFMKKLSLENWVLVLPPWPHLYHWRSDDIFDQNRLPWSLFFNVTEMSFFVPVIEMSNFLEKGKNKIDEVYILQHFEDTFSKKNFKDRIKIEPCIDPIMYKKSSKGYRGDFWGYSNITAHKVECLSFHGPISQLLNVMKKTEAETIMFDHAEIALHDRFGDKTYWDARRSMKFADHLIKEANKFRKKKLNSTDEIEQATWPNNKRTAVGGNYICVHLRRRDFLRGRSKYIPSISGAASQIKKILKNLNLKTLFVATDASKEEQLELKSLLQDYQVVTYNPTKEVKLRYKDGGIAIIEQIICSHARQFLGTHESTFSFRIQEEREILGFLPETTFNRICGDQEINCKPPSKWLIVN